MNILYMQCTVHIYYCTRYLCTCIYIYTIPADPPAPPTSLHATLQTACTAEIVWEMSSSQPSGTALPSFIVIEASLTMDITQNWVHVGRSDVVSGSGRNSLTGRIPAGGVNTMYWLRARSGNASVGVGSYFNQPTPFNAYTEGMGYV